VRSVETPDTSGWRVVDDLSVTGAAVHVGVLEPVIGYYGHFFSFCDRNG
jgi:hypothetical protein